MSKRTHVEQYDASFMTEGDYAAPESVERAQTTQTVQIVTEGAAIFEPAEIGAAERFRKRMEPLRAEHEQRVLAEVNRRSAILEADLIQRGADPKLAKERARAIAESDAGVRNIEAALATNRGSLDEIERRARALVRNEGLSLTEAWTLALNEQDRASEQASSHDRNLCTDRGCLSCNRVSAATLQPEGFKAKGGSKSSRSPEKSFPKRCIYEDCVLQYCDHPKAAGKGGRPTLFDEPKSVRTSGRITEAAAEGYRRAGISENEAQEILGIALLTGRTFEDVWSDRWPLVKAPSRKQDRGAA